jgi:TonB family protein
MDPPVEVLSPFFENLELQQPILLIKDDFIQKKEEKKKIKKVPRAKKKSLKLPKLRSSGPSTGHGSGNIHDRVSQKGLLVILKSKNYRANIVSVAPSAFKFVKDLDNVFKHIKGLKTVGRADFGRKGPINSDFNKGFSGPGGPGSYGIEDLINELASEASTIQGNLYRKPRVKLPPSNVIWKTEAGLAGRNPSDIYRVVTQHIGGLRSEYNKRLRANPRLRGTVTVKFAINQAGSVIWCKVIRSNLRDKMLELNIKKRIKRWKFDACGKCGVAVVTYPFTFSQ